MIKDAEMNFNKLMELIRKESPARAEEMEEYFVNPKEERKSQPKEAEEEKEEQR